MEYKRYTFSNEAKSDLLEFYKVARNKKQDNLKSDTWKLLLPKNEQLVKELNDMLITTVIDLSDDETSTKAEAVEHISDTASVMDVDVNLEENVLNLNDIVESLKEYLEIEKTFSDVATRKLKNLTEDQLNEVYTMLSQNLDTDLICKFGNGILKGDPGEIRITETFIRQILISKLFLEYNAQIYSLFMNFLNSHLNIVCREFSCKLQELPDCTKSILENLAGLNSMYKQSLLREFILTTEKLDKNQFPILDCLISSQIDNESLQKLIELLLAISSVFSNDKMFGKLMLNLISNCKERVRRFEQQLMHIANLHRSVWKNKLNKALNEHIQSDSPLSQSLRY